MDVVIDNDMVTNQFIDIRVKQRNARKSVTTVEGLLNFLPEDVELKAIAKKFRKKFNCSATVMDKSVIQLQGDHRKEIKKLIIENELANADSIRIHGY